MRRYTRSQALIAAALLLAAAGAAAMPGWQLPDLDGRATGPADYPGNWVVVNYWATWCKPCREEMPALDDLARANPGITVLGVAWEDTSAGELKAFLERVPVDYPVLRADPFDPPPDVATGIADDPGVPSRRYIGAAFPRSRESRRHPGSRGFGS